MLTPIKDTRIGLIVAMAVFGKSVLASHVTTYWNSLTGALSILMLVGVVYISVRYYKYKQNNDIGSVNSRTPLLSATLLTQTENST